MEHWLYFWNGGEPERTIENSYRSRTNILPLEALIAKATGRQNVVMSIGAALVANSLCPEEEEHTMREPEVQIGNSGFIETKKEIPA